MPNQPYDEDKQRSRGQSTNGPRYQQGTPYRNRMNGQNPYRPYNRQNPANFSNSLRREFNRNGHFSIPWWVILIAFFAFPMLGIILAVVNMILKQSAANSNRSQSARQNPARNQTPYANPTQNRYQQTPPAAYTAPQQAAQTGTEDKSKADILFIIGVVLMVIGGLGGGAELLENLWILTDLRDVAWYLEEVWPLMIFFLTGLGLCIGARRMRTSWLKRRKIANIVGSADHMYVEDIAASLGCSEQDCYGHLENCIAKGTFGPGAYLDMHSRALIVRGVPPEPKNAPEPQPAPEQDAEKPAEGNEKYEKILRDLRRVNDAIPDENMSDKISRLEAVSAKIFAHIQENPDKLPQMRKFMDYYLPTSLKLLDTYAELDAQGVEGTNIRESKRRIEQSMDTLVVAFENQLDKLFQDDALDVSADIDVMEKMLSADGLTGDSDPFGLSGIK